MNCINRRTATPLPSPEIASALESPKRRLDAIQQVRSNRPVGRENGTSREPSEEQKVFANLANLAAGAQQLEQAAIQADVRIFR